MAKRKKKKAQPVTEREPQISEAQHYWCVNCGNHGDYGKVKTRGFSCEMCGYDEVSLYDLKEINDPETINVSLDKFKTKKKAMLTSAPSPNVPQAVAKTESIKPKVDVGNILDQINKIRNMNKEQM